MLYLGGYSLDKLSLMALTLAVGLVVDDAIVILENIFRYTKQGDDARTAALKGSAEIGFTIVSITVWIIAVFDNRYYSWAASSGGWVREFGVTVSVAVILSALIALTLSPMMAALFIQDPKSVSHRRFYRWSERVLERLLYGYNRALKLVLRFRLWTMLGNLALIGLGG